jgi:hypothetical protein
MRKKLQDPVRKEKFRQKERDNWSIKRKTLSDLYIVCLLTTKYERGLLYKEDIPAELIETKRKALLLKREIKQSCLQ